MRIPFPDKRYDIIYADPPWRLTMGVKSPKDKRRVDAPYPTMTFAEISGLPVGSIAKADSLLFMWVVSPALKECIATGEAWGFEYKTIAFVWHKRQVHLSNYTMPECELCALFKRKKGRIPQPRGARNVKQFISAMRGNHSRKPIAARERIDRMFPSQTKIELFARPDWIDYQQADSWDFWGNEV